MMRALGVFVGLVLSATNGEAREALTIRTVSASTLPDSPTLQIRTVSERQPETTMATTPSAPSPRRLRAWPMSLPLTPLPGSSGRLNLEAYAWEISLAAATHDLDPSWLRAIIHAESAFNPLALSPKGAQGLMQLMPATAQRFNVSDPYQPAQSIQGGATYLAWLRDHFDGDTRLATAAYNAGEGNVARYGGVPPFRETQHYVEKVAALTERYRDALQPTVVDRAVAAVSSLLLAQGPN